MRSEESLTLQKWLDHSTSQRAGWGSRSFVAGSDLFEDKERTAAQGFPFTIKPLAADRITSTVWPCA